MKGKIWELGPFVLAVLIGLYFLTARLRQAAPTPTPVEGKPRTGLPPRKSSGSGDPTRPEDFMPDPHAMPDPNGLPDPSFSTMTRTSRTKR